MSRLPRMPRRFGRAMHRAVRKRALLDWWARNVRDEGLPVVYSRVITPKQVERMVSLLRRPPTGERRDD